MNMEVEAGRSPVTDPDSPSEQIYRILVGEVCKSCAQESLGAKGVASTRIGPGADCHRVATHKGRGHPGFNSVARSTAPAGLRATGIPVTTLLGCAARSGCLRGRAADLLRCVAARERNYSPALPELPTILPSLGRTGTQVTVGAGKTRWHARCSKPAAKAASAEQGTRGIALRASRSMRRPVHRSYLRGAN
jgi:hypothetical protein